MIRFPSVAEYLDAFRKNREIFLSGFILGAALGGLAIALKDEGHVATAEFQRTQMQTEARRQTEEAATREEALKARIAELQASVGGLTDNVAALTQRNATLQDQAAKPAAPAAALPVQLPEPSVKLLLELFGAPTYQEVDKLAGRLRMNIGMTQHYIDILVENGLIDDVAETREDDIPIPSKEGYVTTAKGRSYIVEHGLGTAK